MTRSVGLLMAGWCAWCALHSLCISHVVLHRARRLLGADFAWYRLGYVVASTVSLIPLLLYQYGLEQQLLWQWQGPWRPVQALLVVHTLVMAVGGARAHRLDQVLGLDQIRHARQGQDEAAPTLQTGGILRYVRHPWYSGGLSFLWAFGPVTDVSLAVRCLLSGYLFLGAWLEERKLLREFGEGYRDYRSRTPAFFPWRLLA
ncbi:MAG: hypothetical protein BWK76_09485 [Desulfobulbaceae bacterium A2]|nr:MAG: hypothetical protein BWK76_09485 [Desulfobulbaceae bacterium A2]